MTPDMDLMIVMKIDVNLLGMKPIDVDSDGNGKRIWFDGNGDD